MPRENTLALSADSRFSVLETGKGKWASFRTQSPREMLDAVKTYARTSNELSWVHRPEWCGLGMQSASSLDSSGIPEHAKALMLSASAKLDKKPSRAGRVVPTIVGGSWSVPAVLANLPLAARARARTKLPPLSIRLVCTYSSSVNQERLAPIFAKLARAVWDYTLAGGAVDLRVFTLGLVARSSLGVRGLICETRVPTADVAQLSLALSTSYLRAVTGPLMTALSDASSDTIPVPPAKENPVPNSIYLGGRTSSGNLPELDSVLAKLAIR